MKEQVLEIVRSALSGAEDNLYRAKKQFGHMSESELGQMYGRSGITCGEIYHDAQIKHSELKRCVAWVESAK